MYDDYNFSGHRILNNADLNNTRRDKIIKKFGVKETDDKLIRYILKYWYTFSYLLEPFDTEDEIKEIIRLSVRYKNHIKLIDLFLADMERSTGGGIKQSIIKAVLDKKSGISFLDYEDDSIYWPIGNDSKGCVDEFFRANTNIKESKLEIKKYAEIIYAFKRLPFELLVKYISNYLNLLVGAYVNRAKELFVDVGKNRYARVSSMQECLYRKHFYNGFNIERVGKNIDESILYLTGTPDTYNKACNIFKKSRILSTRVVDTKDRELELGAFYKGVELHIELSKQGIVVPVYALEESEDILNLIFEIDNGEQLELLKNMGHIEEVRKTKKYIDMYKYIKYSGLTMEEIFKLERMTVVALNFECKIDKEAYEKVTGEDYDTYFEENKAEIRHKNIMRYVFGA